MSYDKDYLTLPLTFERGLIEYIEDSMLPPGAAATLQNWVPDPSGNLRVRRAWEKASTTSAPSTRKGWGIGHLALPHRPYRVQRAQATAASYDNPITATATWPAATTAGNLLVLKVGTHNYQTAAGTIGVPAGWTLAKQEYRDDGSAYYTYKAAIYYKANAATESGNVAVTLTTTVGTEAKSLAIEISEVANIVATSPLDQTASAEGDTGTTHSSGTTAATSQQVEWAEALIQSSYPSASPTHSHSAQTNGFTEVADFAASATYTHVDLATYSKILESTNAQSVSATGQSEAWCGIICTFKAVNYADTDGFYFVANNEDPNIKIYYVDQDNLSSGTWTLLESITAAPDVVPVAFTSGNGKLFYTHPSFEGTAGVRQWGGVGTSPAGITNAPAGRCIAWHKSRLFVAGTTGESHKLYYSEVGDHTNWTTGTAGYIEVNLGDGEPIEDIAPYEDGLLIGKATSMFYLAGSGPGSFRLIRIPTNTGISPGRTITPTNYGAFLAGDSIVQVFGNGNISKVSNNIETSYGKTGNWMNGGVVNDTYYVLDQGSGKIWSLDLNEGTWTTETIGSASTEGPACLYNFKHTLLFGPKNASVGSILSYREEPGAARGKDFNTLSEAFEAWTPEIWPLGPDQNLTPRYLFLKLRQRGSGYGQVGLTVIPFYDGREQESLLIEPFDYAGVYRVRKSLGAERGVSSFQLRFYQTATNGTSVVWDIEEVTVGFNVERVR